MTALLAACLVLLASGLASRATARWPRCCVAIGSAGAPLAALLSALPVARALAGAEARAELFWSVPGGVLAFGLDALSAFFLVPTLVLSALGAIFARGYLAQETDTRRVGTSWLFFNMLCAAMIAVPLARNGVLFLVAWETMSLCAYVLVSFEHWHAEARRAGWIYLIASHVGTAALLALVALLGDGFSASRGAGLAASGAGAATICALALLGFGVKAGLVPLHVWLPEAHAAAPSHVSALMSGAMVKLGYYGLLRMVWLLGGVSLSFALVLAVLGLAGALVGIALSLSQRDLKRALAQSSVENLGLIGLALGLGLAGLAVQDERLAVLGLAAGLLHVWNHAAMKALLFLSAGALQHASGTRDLERLGGLVRAMPRAALCFAVGAVALSALPPLNGFASEWLLVLTLLGQLVSPTALASAGGALALGLVVLTGGLALAAFVRLFGLAFLGQPCSGLERAHDVRGSMLVALVALAVLCSALGLAPQRGVAALSAVIAGLLGADPSAPGLASELLRPVSALSLGLWSAASLAALVTSVWLRRAAPRPEETWGCGYPAPGARMQYTALSFSRILARAVLPSALWPQVAGALPVGPCPPPSVIHARYADPLIARIYQPLFSAVARAFTRLRLLQQGNAHLYLAYIMLAVVAALAWASLLPQGPQ